MSVLYLLIVQGICTVVLFVHADNKERYRRYVIDNCGTSTCTPTYPDCIKRFSHGPGPLRCMNGKTLCNMTIKHFIDLNDIDLDEYVVFDDWFIDYLFALPPPDQAGNTSWVYIEDKQFEYAEIRLRPHNHPDYVFLMTDYG